jgi:uncharacterized protein (DUF1697 family)
MDLRVTVVISMLRGVNVGGHHQIKMDALRELYASLGLRDAQTYIQSGNVIFRTERRHLARLPARIADGIEQSFGFRPDVILRTLPELLDVIASNPFAARQGINPSRLLVTFLAQDPDQEARDRVLKMDAAPEEIQIIGRQLYAHCPNGMARPKLSWAVIERALKTSGTGRNWNTVQKLAGMAGKLEASP